jgi:hypothetical protein
LFLFFVCQRNGSDDDKEMAYAVELGYIVDHYCLIFDRGKGFVLLLVILSTINASLLIFKVGIKTNIYFLAWIATLHN